MKQGYTIRSRLVIFISSNSKSYRIFTGPSSLDDDTANTNKIPSVIFDYGDRNEQIYGGHILGLHYCKYASVE